MKLRDMFKALADGVKLEYEHNNGKWFPIKATSDLPRAQVPSDLDFELVMVRIAKEYVTVDGKQYEKPAVCKELKYNQGYFFVDSFGVVCSGWHTSAGLHSHLDQHNAYPTREEAMLAAMIIKATYVSISK